MSSKEKMLITKGRFAVKFLTIISPFLLINKKREQEVKKIFKKII